MHHSNSALPVVCSLHALEHAVLVTPAAHTGAATKPSMVCLAERGKAQGFTTLPAVVAVSSGSHPCDQHATLAGCALPVSKDLE